MTRKRDYISEIEEIKGRTGPDEWDNGITKLLFLSSHLSMHGSELESGDELGYFPVAAIAAMEVYFRWEIRRLIDSGDIRFVNNLRIEELPLKINHEFLLALQGKRVSVGEIVAHAVHLNGLAAILSTMSKLLDCDFSNIVEKARDPEKIRELGENAPLILQSPDDTFKDVDWTFQVRNIICHEAHLNQSMSVEDVKRMCSACYEFVLASHYGIAHHRNPSAPLTLMEAIKETTEEVKQLDADLRSIESRINSALGPPVQTTFVEMQEAWRMFVQKEADFAEGHDMNGTRGHLTGLRSVKYAHQERVDRLKEYAEKMQRADVSGLPKRSTK